MSSRLEGLLSLLGLALVLAITGCGGDEARAGSLPARHVQWIVAADLSASRNSSQLQESQAFVSSLLGKATNGDRLVLLRVYERGLAGSGFMWDHEIAPAKDAAHPAASDSMELEEADQALHAVLTVLFDPKIEGTLQGTDIMATLYRVSDLAHGDASRRTAVFLLSDMLQSTHDLNMERTVPDTSWVLEHARAHLLPDLRHVCIVAIGPDVSGSRGQRVLQFWRAYFKAAGADFRESNYRNWAPDASQLGCW